MTLIYVCVCVCVCVCVYIYIYIYIYIYVPHQSKILLYLLNDTCIYNTSLLTHKSIL